MLKIIFIILSIFSWQSANAQKEAYNWYFGNRAGFSFTNGRLEPIRNSPMNATSSSVAISDKDTGDLLFFSDGKTVWNRELTPMPNGSNLIAPFRGNQSSLIVPMPNDKNRYYLFTLGSNIRKGEFDSDIGMSLYYSIIDMQLENGLGDVVSGTKNTLLLQDTLVDKLTAIPHLEEDAYWLITHQLESNHFFIHFIGEQGINSPLMQSIGSVLPAGFDFSSRRNIDYGFLKASPNGKKLAMTHEWVFDTLNTVDLFDFDARNGIISNHINLGDTYLIPDAISFSPDNSKLYLVGVYSRFEPNSLHQFEVNESDIKASRFSYATSAITRESSSPNFSLAIFTLDLAPDGNIYSVYTNGEDNSLFSINCPNEKGLAADLRHRFIEYGNGSVTFRRLPNFMQHYFQEENLLSSNEQCGTPCNFSADVVLFPNPTSDLLTITVQEGCFTGDLLEELNEINLYSVNGQLARKNIPIATTISLAGLPAGAYIIELWFSQALVRKKVIHLGNP